MGAKIGGAVAPSGKLRLVVKRPGVRLRPFIRMVWEDGFPHRGLPKEVNRWRRSQLRRTIPQALRLLLALFFVKHSSAMVAYGTLRLKLWRKSEGRDEVLDLGLAGMRVVTTAFVNYLTDALQADQAFEDFKFHGFGTGTNAEAVGDTGLQTELTTEYAVDSTRPTGSQTESAANIYRTVGTLDPDSAVAITEHGIFRAATGATTLMDRSQFSVVNVAASGDTLEATYDFTTAAGS